MKLINHNDTIYLEFISSSKIIKKSLKLPYNAKNLKYAKSTLMPIFKKLYEVKTKSSIKTKKTKPSKGKTIMFNEICQMSLNELKLHSKLTTTNTALYAYKRVFDFLEDKDTKAYSKDDLQLAIFNMQKKLKPKTIHLMISYLNLAFKKSLHLGILQQNPMQNLKKPRIPKTHKNILNTREISSLLKNATDELKLFLYIAFYTGARSGEILALQKDDIDFKTNIIKITKNQTRYELTTPKNGNFRFISIPTKLAKFLKQNLKHINSDKIFKSDYFQMYYQFKKLLKSLNLPACGLHITRHCYATILLNNSVSPIFIAKNLGHSNLKEINNTYSHYIFDKNESKILEKALDF